MSELQEERVKDLEKIVFLLEFFHGTNDGWFFEPKVVGNEGKEGVGEEAETLFLFALQHLFDAFEDFVSLVDLILADLSKGHSIDIDLKAQKRVIKHLDIKDERHLQKHQRKADISFNQSDQKTSKSTNEILDGRRESAVDGRFLGRRSRRCGWRIVSFEIHLDQNVLSFAWLKVGPVVPRVARLVKEPAMIVKDDTVLVITSVNRKKG